MANVILDLATKVVSNTQTIWAVFPGRGRRLIDLFLEKDVIFLETPGLNLSPNVLMDDDLLRRHIAMSEAVLDFALGHSDSRPSQRAQQYQVKRSPSFNAAVGNVRNMYAKIKPGDLVIMGGRSIYQPVYAGEIVGAFRAEDKLEIPMFANYEVPVRNVKWLSVQEERRYLSERLSHLLSNRKTVIVVGKEEFADEVYTLAYGDYVFGEDSRYVFPGPLYRNIATSTVPGIDLISYFVAAFHACDIGELDKFSALDIRVAIDAYFEQDILRSFKLEFSSPGNYVVHSRRAALALTAALLVSATMGSMTLAEARGAEIANSADKSAMSHQEVEIEQKYRAIMESLGAERYNQLVRLNKQAQDGVGLKVNVKQKRKKV